ncbi:MAG: glycosyltransferase [Patescibacteria group bacterium]
MLTPVIIAAHNESRLIGLCLDSLDRDPSLEPIVAANGCTDDTVRIAREYGARVLDIEAPGKLPAIQRALGTLGVRALEPVLYLDADSYPLNPSQWSARMTEAVYTDSPEARAASGPLAYFDGNPLSDAVRSLKRYYDVRKAQRNNTTHFWGNNDKKFFRKICP